MMLTNGKWMGVYGLLKQVVCIILILKRDTERAWKDNSLHLVMNILKLGKM